MVNVKKDYDSDSDTDETTNKLSHEDVTIKERYNKVWQGSEVIIIMIITIIIIISIFLACTCSCFVYVLF